MNNTELWRLTSIKLLIDVYGKFREECKANGVTLQKLVNRSMFLYLNNPEFRSQIKEIKDLKENYKNGY